ncbi:MAG TPA: hypothetical protein VMW16_05305 [Sedimentisphaerales bacterium]|nr:hypothetical protein [Sedimentisphaerales bacterium]
MKKRDIWICLAIIAGAIAVLNLYWRREGYIKVDTPGFHTTVHLRRGWWRSAVAMSDKGPVKVHAGAYKLTQAKLRAEESQDKWWTILCRDGRGRKQSRIQVTDGETTVLKLGPPLTVHPEVWRRGRDVSIGLSLIGQGGEHWIPQVLTPKKPLPAPRLKIVDESGNVLASGKFEYG